MASEVKFKTQAGAKAYMYLLTIVFIGGFIFLLISYINYKNVYDNGLETQAAVISVDSVSHGRRGSVSKYGKAVYHDEQGMEHTYSGYIGAAEADVGSIFTIIYNKDHPDEVVKENGFLIWGVIISGIFAAGCLVGAYFITFRSYDKKVVKCVQQSVSNEELARVVREYMPQTRENYIKKRNKYKGFDRLGYDSVIESMINAGDTVGEIYKNQKDVRQFGDIRLAAVIRPTDNNIYSDKVAFGEEYGSAANGRLVVPAFAVYGADGYLEAHPNELKLIANKLCGDFFGGSVSDDDSRLIEFLRNNNARPFNYQYCGELSMGHPVYITTVLLIKTQLCNKKLSNKLLYILTNPDATPYSLVLPAWYYSMWELSAF